MAKRILIIEDEEPLAEEWEIGLKYEGYDTEIAPDMASVVGILDNLDFDLVLLDIMLPTIDVSGVVDLPAIQYGRTAGVWIAEEIKRRKPSLPIVVVTVVTDTQIIKDLKDIGAKRILNKPVFVQEVVETVARYLKENS